RDEAARSGRGRRAHRCAPRGPQSDGPRVIAASPQLLARVAGIARRASGEILEVYAGGELAATAKADASPLTAADVRAHRLIVDALRELAPDVPVLSEESVHTPFAQRSLWGRYWLVDPLDGTREFLSRNGEFTVNIALIEGHAPSLGVVHVPSGEWSTAAADAVITAAGGPVCRLDAAPLEYNTREALLNPSFVAFGPRDRDWLALLEPAP